jgi:hypothetical protein
MQDEVVLADETAVEPEAGGGVGKVCAGAPTGADWAFGERLVEARTAICFCDSDIAIPAV